MRLTTKGRFAVTAMIDIALHSTNGPVTLAGVAERQHISLSYLEQLFGKLRRRGLVESVRGPGGGYSLARAAATVTVADIILAVDEPIDATSCGGEENCQDDKRCMTHDLWAGLNKHIHAYLAEISLAQLMPAKRNSKVVLHDNRARREPVAMAD
ncbi:MAG: Fe-S cluster assembly transcriptional regulator IscR [Betaproteobacteria bacterium]|nr:Fe-S cluster assembly transcriptional regulator IscR [Betaproteobacteria bacterium]